jgi:small subunit ribosomal protein S1
VDDLAPGAAPPLSGALPDWPAAELARDRGEIFHLKVSGANRGGLLVEWNGLQGFVPASHLLDPPQRQYPQERMNELSRRIGEALTLRLIEVDPQQSRLVFSERAASTEPQAPAAIRRGNHSVVAPPPVGVHPLWGSVHAGDVCQGTITHVTSFGAFVDLGGVEGLLHVSELSWDRVRHPGDLLSPGMEVETQVLDVNPEERRIALSLKRLRSNPWVNAEQHYQVGQVVEGTITNVVSFGAFVRLEEGLEGLIHVSELAGGSFLHPRNVVHEGNQVRVRVLNVDVAHRRLGLSLRQVPDVEAG